MNKIDRKSHLPTFGKIVGGKSPDVSGGGGSLHKSLLQHDLLQYLWKYYMFEFVFSIQRQNLQLFMPSMYIFNQHNKNRSLFVFTHVKILEKKK